MNQIKSLLLISLCLIGLSLTAQSHKYLYERKSGESANDFVERHLKGFHSSDIATHDVLEGAWGDESKGKKIMAFYSLGLMQEYDDATMAIFQPIGDGKNYILILSNEFARPGTYYQGIISVFFMDINADGYKELFLLEKGESRVGVTLESENEAGETVYHETTACCEDAYDTIILEQLRDEALGFLPYIKACENCEKWDFEGLENASAIKKKITAAKKN